MLFCRDSKASGGACAFGQPRTLKFTKSIFTNNTAPHEGGALSIFPFLNNDVIKLVWFEVSDCLFTHNRALFGGALFTASTNVTLMMKNCTFKENEAALWFNGISVNISDSVFSGNKGTQGSAIYFEGKFCAFYLMHSKLFSNNHATELEKAEFQSAVIVNMAELVFMFGVQFYNNSASGGISLLAEKCEIHNCAFQGNTGDEGAAMTTYPRTSVVLITNSSFVENKATNGDLCFYNNQVIIQNSHFGKPTTISSHPVTFLTRKRVEFRSYNNVFIKPNNFAPQMGIYGPTAKVATVYIWKTFCSQLGKTKLLPVDQDSVHNQTMPISLFEEASNITHVFSPYASGEFNQEQKGTCILNV